ncbi:Tubulin monoglycylase TTLL3 [Hondaea fermentalgiana]|uniref:Tubulin monoglycylase TTLL3 n=1 Tax=Hondaea fermentalgiana TaxID=2315210 RepID=A0A2R5G0V4_9STRA|nr:Tubulin monoglycylase TTLL3 [Hondaea fermentalgiana]|eukprot:GBG24642.1 Tubulin monoglycylase TTLL3 [Hondaea fermentalgiana]
MSSRGEDQTPASKSATDLVSNTEVKQQQQQQEQPERPPHVGLATTGSTTQVAALRPVRHEEAGAQQHREEVTEGGTTQGEGDASPASKKQRAISGPVNRRGGVSSLDECKVDILHQSDDHLVIDKPADFRLDGDFPVTVENFVKKIIPEEAKRPRWVHQLDFATSGVLCIGLCRRGAGNASKLFQERLTRKYYVALVKGKLRPAKPAAKRPLPFVMSQGDAAEQTSVPTDQTADQEVCHEAFRFAPGQPSVRVRECWERAEAFGIRTKELEQDEDSTSGSTLLERLLRNQYEDAASSGYLPVFDVEGAIAEPSKDDFRMVIDNAAGREARTQILPIAYGQLHGEDVTKVIMRPIQGRRHQLRLHCMHLGFPIVGDATYGARDEDEVAPRWRQGAAKVQRSRTRATGQQDRGARHAKARVFEACGAQSSHLRPLVRTLEQHGWSRNAQKHPGGGGSGLPSTISLRSCSLLLTVENLPTASLLRRNKHLFYNHFERNTEITTKHALAQNLDLLHWNHGVSAKQVFPRCYSLHDDAGRRNFREDYRQTAAASVVRSILEVGDEALRLVDTRLFRMALLVCDERVGRLLGQVSRARTFSDAEWESLVELSAQLAVLDGTSANTTQRIAGLDAQVGGLVAKARQLASQLSRLDPQWIMNGRRNIWIVKPGDKSKAAGIFLHNQLKAIEANGARMGGARIVQKYIENPQLGPGHRKLDLRVWVLVTSWAPLKAWIYNPFYCRMCRDPYSLDARDLSRASVHLCNASVQGPGSILSMENLLLHLRSEGQVSTAADERKLSASIETACRLALQAGLHKVVHRDRSFELYGIDLLLDDELRCWLLEVNLSPGFGKHDDAFTAMVERMLHGMHDLVFARSANDASECRDVAPERSCQSTGGWKPLTTGAAESNNGQSSSNEDLDLPTQRVDPRNGQDVSDCEEEPRRVKLSAAASLRLLVKGHRLHRRQISRLDNAIRSGEALEAIARFTSMCKQNWPALPAPLDI